jgi:Tol biopolymer transport system component
VSADGNRLLYMRGSTRSSLWRLDLRSPSTGPVLLTPGTSTLSSPELSPDGRNLVAVQGQESSVPQIVKLSADGGEPVRLGAGFGQSDRVHLEPKRANPGVDQ